MTTHDLHHHDHHQAASARVTFGFWVFLMTDCISFAVLFAVYAVLHTVAGITSVVNTIGLPAILEQSLVLLTAAFVCGLSPWALHHGSKIRGAFYLVVTVVLGMAFAELEYTQFMRLGWVPDGFYSALYGLLGIHLFHVLIGLLWAAILLIQLLTQGITPTIKTRFTCLSLFWNFLNIIWIFIFTIVYLMGALHV